MQFKDAESAKKFDKRLRAIKRAIRMKQEKLCESEDMLSGWPEELGAENAAIRRQLRDAEILSSFPEDFKALGLQPKPKPTVRLASSRQVAGEHYKRMDIQPWDVIDFGPREQAIGFYRYNALKYVMRAGEKGELKEDLAKAHHYLEKLLEIL